MVLLAIALAGCSKPAVHVLKASAPNLPSGWTKAVDDTGTVSVGVANGWHEGVDTPLAGSGLDLAQGIAGSASTPTTDTENPAGQLANQMAADDAKDQQEGKEALKAKGVVIQIIDASKPIPGEARTRYYVKVDKHDGNILLDGALDEEKEFLRGTGAGDPVKVDLPIGPAYRFDADRKTIGGDELTRISYVVVDGKNSYHLRFVSTNNPTSIQSIAKDVADSWRIKPSQD
jgi:hypothetical protein